MCETTKGYSSPLPLALLMSTCVPTKELCMVDLGFAPAVDLYPPRAVPVSTESVLGFLRNIRPLTLAIMFMHLPLDLFWENDYSVCGSMW